MSRSDSLSVDMSDGGTKGCVCDGSDKTDVSEEISLEEQAVVWIITPALIFLIFIILIVIWMLCRRPRVMPKMIPYDEPAESIVYVEDMEEEFETPIDPVDMRRLRHHTSALRAHPPIQVNELTKKVKKLKANNNELFTQEYESIEPEQQFTWEISSLEMNKPKNRYVNVVAYDHSRVVLQTLESIPGSDYINANFCDGYRKQKAYIATQGPLPDTYGDFWRMVWEQKSSTIVMLSKLVENERPKCDQYWPNRGSQTYGVMYVSLSEVQEFASYSIRTFNLERVGSADKREVLHFQFTAWPEHGVPNHPASFLMFVRRVRAMLDPTTTGPIVVHCSAGVGRTGCFIVIDSMLERLKHETTVDIYGHVTCLRAQRNYMVQTEEQYIFTYNAVLEASATNMTEVLPCNLYPHIQQLLHLPPGEKHTKMELEFQKISKIRKNTAEFVSANLPVNKLKNRFVNILPYESTRVSLGPIGGMDGSDYINANYIDSYRHKRAYIATQGPLSNTTADFWRMLWEQNCRIIVMLTKVTELEKEKCHQYWPDEKPQRHLYFTVVPVTEYNMPHHVMREFRITDTRNGQSRTIRRFHYMDWPEKSVPKSGGRFVEFIGQVLKTKHQFGQEGPVTIHCCDGVGRTGVFILLSIVLERMTYEGVIDIFQYVCILRTQRPGMVQTEEQYQFCYRATLEYVSSLEQ